jgi:hypothetical protein
MTGLEGGVNTNGNAVRVLLADALSLGLALLEGVLVLKLASHFGGDCVRGEKGDVWSTSWETLVLGKMGIADGRKYLATYCLSRW